MTKKIVGIVVSVMILLVLAQHFRNDGAKVKGNAAAPQAAGQSETDMAPSDSVEPHPDSLPPPEMAVDEKVVTTACNGGSLDDIYAAHGSAWGLPRPAGRSFNEEQSEALYHYLVAYHSCRAAMTGSLSHCDFRGGRAKRVTRPETPTQECRDRAATARMLAVMAGRDKETTACSMFLSAFSELKLPLSAGELCRAASGGMENLCGAVTANMGKTAAGQCMRKFPPTQESCGPDSNCTETWMAYDSIKTWQAGACPDSYRGVCEAIISGNPGACEALALDVSALYCGFKEGKKLDLSTVRGGGRIASMMQRYEAEKAYNAKVRRQIKEFNEEGERMEQEMRNFKGRGFGSGDR